MLLTNAGRGPDEDKNIIANGDASLILELAAGVDEHALADLGVLPAVRMERREHGERFVDLAGRQPGLSAAFTSRSTRGAVPIANRSATVRRSSSVIFDCLPLTDS